MAAGAGQKASRTGAPALERAMPMVVLPAQRAGRDDHLRAIGPGEGAAGRADHRRHALGLGRRLGRVAAAAAGAEQRGQQHTGDEPQRQGQAWAWGWCDSEHEDLRAVGLPLGPHDRQSRVRATVPKVTT
ncbi:hypothetical protein ACFJI0_24170 [Hydrogenophaga sp. UC242_53]|uniref:hypothetical protein n=1 Tax=Hydrogenophaga sp. UC242_53 TaxID=3350170 RepID=UPI0036D24255